MKYIEQVNNSIRSTLAANPGVVIFGQNVSAGSRISGLTRGLTEVSGSHSFNTPNCENNLVGVGFGLMLNGVSSIFFMKQLDFLLLGIDQIVNTYNMVRTLQPAASFTIVPVVVDLPYQGGQSSFNSIDDFCSIARVEAFCISSGHDAETIIANHLVTSGFRIVTVSQRMFGVDTESLPEPSLSAKDGGWFRYYEGTDATIVCFNFSFPQGVKLRDEMAAAGVSASLFTINDVMASSPSVLLDDAEKTGQLVVLNDSKSLNKSSLRFVAAARERSQTLFIAEIERPFEPNWFAPNAEILTPDYNTIIEKTKKAASV